MNLQQKITPGLWFHEEGGNLAQVIEYYQAIFGDYLKAGPVIPLGETPGGNSEMGEIEIFDRKYSLICTSLKHKPFTDASSLILQCEDQAEIDKYWNYFTADGQESMCGWCYDKYGLAWQIIPDNMDVLMSRSNAAEVMMKQKKIVIAEY